MTPTNSAALSAAIKAAIEAIAPTLGPSWHFVTAPREQGTALHLLGNPVHDFDLIFEAGAESRLWYGNGAAYSCLLRIATSYEDTPDEDRDHMIMADAVDLVRMFMQIADPTVPGFAFAVQQRSGPIYRDDPPNNAMVEHLFEIHWSQTTA